MRLSVCMIVKNEEGVLDRCLSAASQIADELIIVDTGSEDGTKEIAGRYTSLIYDYPWHDSFCDARNYSFEKAGGDYLMWLDADDVIDDENIDRILRLKEAAFEDADVVFTIHRNYSETGLTSYWFRDRFFRKSLHPIWTSDVHEAIQIDKSWRVIEREDITILHKKEYFPDDGRNLRIFDRILRENKEFGDHDKVNLCGELVCDERYEEACGLYREIRQELSGTDLINALHYVEPAFLALERYEELYALIGEAEQRIPPIAKDRFTKGVCRRYLGDLAGAAELFIEAAGIPDDPRTQGIIETGYNDYYPFIRLAFIAYHMGNTEEALRNLAAAGEKYPNAPEWRLVREKMLMETPPADPCRKSRIAH